MLGWGISTLVENKKETREIEGTINFGQNNITFLQKLSETMLTLHAASGVQ